MYIFNLYLPHFKKKNTMKKIKRKFNNKNRFKLFDIKNIAFVIAINIIINMIITSIIIK